MILEAAEHFTDDEYAALQNALAADPEVGDLIRASGGVRKLRCGLAGHGKRGGVRVIYYLQLRQGQVWMLRPSTSRSTHGAGTAGGP